MMCNPVSLNESPKTMMRRDEPIHALVIRDVTWREGYIQAKYRRLQTTNAAIACTRVRRRRCMLSTEPKRRKIYIQELDMCEVVAENGRTRTETEKEKETERERRLQDWARVGDV
jgi:hypothetical protein